MYLLVDFMQLVTIRFNLYLGQMRACYTLVCSGVVVTIFLHQNDKLTFWSTIDLMRRRTGPRIQSFAKISLDSNT